jgi:hypothetical protein
LGELGRICSGGRARLPGVLCRAWITGTPFCRSRFKDVTKAKTFPPVAALIDVYIRLRDKFGASRRSLDPNDDIRAQWP